MSAYDVTVQQLQSIPLAVIRRQVRASELARVVPESCGVVWNAMRAQQTPAGRHVAIYWDGSIRLDVGVEVRGPFVDDGTVIHSETPAGEVVTTTHFGPYGGLHAAHEAVRQWCAAHQRPLAGPSWEIYGHWEPQWDTDPARIRTDVFYLLSGGGGE